MRCRKLVNNNIVWFNSYGKDLNGKSLKANNYSEGNDGLCDSLTQRLSVIKGELWYSINYGIPLFDKVNKGIMDATILDIINSHSDINTIKSFESTVENRDYKLEFTAISNFGDIELKLILAL